MKWVMSILIGGAAIAINFYYPKVGEFILWTTFGYAVRAFLEVVYD